MSFHWFELVRVARTGSGRAYAGVVENDEKPLQRSWMRVGEKKGVLREWMARNGRSPTNSRLSTADNDLNAIGFSSFEHPSRFGGGGSVRLTAQFADAAGNGTRHTPPHVVAIARRALLCQSTFDTNVGRECVEQILVVVLTTIVESIERLLAVGASLLVERTGHFV